VRKAVIDGLSMAGEEEMLGRTVAYRYDNNDPIAMVANRQFPLVE
jgi:hypothetical protein